MLNRRPIKLWHFYFSIVYGVAYALFSLFYWMGDGLGNCLPDSEVDLTKPTSSPRKVIFIDGVKYDCAEFIYPILDWGGHPGLACITIVVAAIALPCVHMFWMGMVWLRTKIYSRTLGKTPAPPVSSVDIEVDYL